MNPITKSELHNLIDTVDSKLYSFSKEFSKVKTSLDSKLVIYSSVCNERTLSDFSNEMIRDFFLKYDSNVFIANEFYIKTKSISKYDILLKLDEVGLKGRIKRKYDRCYVDGLLCVNNLYFPDKNYVFIEYKLNNKFIYNELALDFLKYKLITKYNAMNTIFAFVVFDKKDDYPSIIDTSKSTHKYFLLPKKIDNTISKSKIYIYVPSNVKHDKEFFDYNDSLKIINEMINIKKISNLIDLTRDVNQTEFDRLLVDLIKKINAKVFKARIIKDNFKNIETLWNLLKTTENNEIITKLNKFELDKENVKEIVSIISGSANHFKNIFSNILSKKRDEAISSGMTAYYQKSLYMLISFELLGDLLLPNHNVVFEYGRNNVNSKNKKLLDRASIAHDIKYVLNQIYNQAAYKEKFINSVLSLLFYFHYVYPLVFEIENGFVGEERNNKTTDELYASVKKSINKLNRMLGIKNQIKTNKYSEFNPTDLLDYVTVILKRSV